MRAAGRGASSSPSPGRGSGRTANAPPFPPAGGPAAPAASRGGVDRGGGVGGRYCAAQPAGGAGGEPSDGEPEPSASSLPAVAPSPCLLYAATSNAPSSDPPPAAAAASAMARRCGRREVQEEG